MKQVRVIRAVASQWTLIRDVRLRALENAPQAFSATLAESQARSDESWKTRAAREDVANFLAVDANEQSCGMVMGAPHTDYTQSAGLFGMWVAPEARGHGVGKLLVHAVIRWARDRNHQRIYLDVGDENTAAIALYESCGFRPSGRKLTLPPPRQFVHEHERVLDLASGPGDPDGAVAWSAE